MSENNKSGETKKVRRFSAETEKSTKKLKPIYYFIGAGGLLVVIIILAVVFAGSAPGPATSEDIQNPVVVQNNTSSTGTSTTNEKLVSNNTAETKPNATENKAATTTTETAKDSPPKPAEKPEARTEIAIPLAKINDSQAHYYSYNISSGKKIRFFVLKSSDDVFRAAFDACDVCYQAKKGYRQDGDFMVCNNCGQRFESVRINEVKGGCNPAPLDRVIRGDQLIVKIDDLQTGGFYF